MKPGSGHASFLTIPRDYFFPFGDHLGTTVFTVVYYFFTQRNSPLLISIGLLAEPVSLLNTDRF